MGITLYLTYFHISHVRKAKAQLRSARPVKSIFRIPKNADLSVKQAYRHFAKGGQMVTGKTLGIATGISYAIAETAVYVRV